MAKKTGPKISEPYWVLRVAAGKHSPACYHIGMDGKPALFKTRAKASAFKRELQYPSQYKRRMKPARADLEER